MKISRQIVDKLVELAIEDKIPMDMSELSPDHFAFLDEQTLHKPNTEYKVEVITELTIHGDEKADIDQIMADMDYNFKSRTNGSVITKTEIIGHNFINSEPL